MSSQMNSPRRQLMDLPDDMLCEVFSRLSTNDLLATERVSRDWRRCVDLVVGKHVEVVSFGYRMPYFRCSHYFQIYKERCEIILNSKHFVSEFNSTYQQTVIPLLTRCPNVKCLDLSSATIEINCLRSLVNACPRLECLCLGDINATHDEWNRFAEEIATKLVHLNFADSFKLPLHDLLADCHNLRHIHLEADASGSEIFDQIFSLSHHVNYVNTTKQTIYSLKLRGRFLNQDPSWMLDLVQCISYLTIDLGMLRDIYDFDSSCLNKVHLLSVFHKLDFVDDEEDDQEVETMTFKYLNTLMLNNFDVASLNWMAKNKFQLLKNLHLKNVNLQSDENLEFFSKMPYFESLYFNNSLHVLGRGLTHLDRLKLFSACIGVWKPEMIPKVTYMLDCLAKIGLFLDDVYLSCYFSKLISVPIDDKQALVSTISKLSNLLAMAKIDIQLIFSRSEYAEDCVELDEWHVLINQIQSVKLLKAKDYVNTFEGYEFKTSYVSTFKFRVKFEKMEKLLPFF